MSGDSQPTAVIIPEDLLEQIYQEARVAFPAECCGWLVGDKSPARATAMRACQNQQGAGDHPTAPERGAETAYVIAGADLLAFTRSLDAEQPALVIYHSHPNGRAYLSETDKQVATSPWGDGPTYPVQQLVVGIDDTAVREAALFAWSDQAGGFVEIARFAGAPL